MFIIIFLSNCVSGSFFIIFFFLAKFEDFFKKKILKRELQAIIWFILK